MLWLGFKDLKQIKIQDKWLNDYDTTNVVQHDRLTVTDYRDSLCWFVMRGKLSITDQMQDPEWSAHPNYVVCLGQESGLTGPYGGYVINVTSDPLKPNYLRFCKTGLIEPSSPHLWLPDSCQVNGNVINPPI
jgi:hypothetical protein